MRRDVMRLSVITSVATLTLNSCVLARGRMRSTTSCALRTRRVTGQSIQTLTFLLAHEQINHTIYCGLLESQTNAKRKWRTSTEQTGQQLLVLTRQSQVTAQHT